METVKRRGRRPKTDESENGSDKPVMTGYESEDLYFATRYRQGGRTVYNLDLPISALTTQLPRPDPNRPTPGNRRVKDGHARDFSRYSRENTDMVIPSLLLRTPEEFPLEVREEVSGSEFGILHIPRNKRPEVRIIDGQHRVLGVCYAIEEIALQKEKATADLMSAQKTGNREAEAAARQQLVDLEMQQERLGRERVSVQIHVEPDPHKFEQIFVDVADNALGITSAVRVRFDTRNPINRALEEVLRHALLKERVDMEQDRIGMASPYLMGAKHVADAIRLVTLGYAARATRGRQLELQEAALVENANNFFDSLIEGFEGVAKVADGEITPEALRRNSLLGSVTIQQVLASVYHELTGEGWTEGEITDFWKSLEPMMGVPVAKGAEWPVNVLPEGASAPKASRPDIVALVRWIVARAQASGIKQETEEPLTGETSTEVSQEAA
jgi:hypothetical protein